ncbi:chorismate-binding protein, partial [Klebsiella pneumoniae]|uniref:chorismate-binding protein n=1 Tax=Klebsiella pneumoniae TaxID=573 RepID=UPI003857AC8A
PAYGPQNDVTLKMPAFEWVHVQLHQQKGMISLSPPTICNSALVLRSVFQDSQRCWIQAGAGIIAQSTPERELTETREKLASIAPYLMV